MPAFGEGVEFKHRARHTIRGHMEVGGFLGGREKTVGDLEGIYVVQSLLAQCL